MTVSVRDVAELAGVSVGTVSNVLNSPSKVAPATAQRVHAAIDEIGFVRNDAARQLRAGSSKSVGLLVLDMRNPFFTDVARGVEERAAEVGLSVLLANSDERVDREDSHLELFEEQRVRGVLISPVDEVVPRLERLRARGIPAILVDRRASSDGWSSVSVDDVRGGRAAATHLLARGRRRILFVGGPLDLRQVSDRLDGARAAVREVVDARIEVFPVEALTMQNGAIVGRALSTLQFKPDAVFAANDLVALGVLHGTGRDPATRIPEDLAIVGYDDIDFAASAAIPITSVRQPRRQMGMAAIDLLLTELDGGPHERIVLAPELIVRESTRT